MDYENWKKITHNRIIKLVEERNIDSAIDFSLSNNLIDIPLDIYERVAKLRGGNIQRDLRKKAGDLSKKYGLFKRAIDNYLSMPPRKSKKDIEKEMDKLFYPLYSVIHTKNLINKKVAYSDLSKHSLPDFFYKN